MISRTEDGAFSHLSRAELEAALAEALEKAAGAEAVEEAFMAAMTHELRTPLNAIQGFSDALLQGLSGPLNEVQRRQLSAIERSSKRLINLVNDVLDLTKARTGGLELAVEEIDLGASIVKETEAIRPECEARGLALELELGPEPRLALGDRRRVEQVLRHLLSNALKFTEEGGIGIALAIGAEGAVVAIRDSGRGIDAKDLERIWTPFRQLDEGHARAYEGMGIGLSLSRLILAAMGGSIAVESRPGEGSTFSVELPLYLGPR